MPIHNKRPRKPSKAKIQAVQERYRRSANELLALATALEANAVFETPASIAYELVCTARDLALAEVLP